MEMKCIFNKFIWFEWLRLVAVAEQTFLVYGSVSINF